MSYSERHVTVNLVDIPEREIKWFIMMAFGRRSGPSGKKLPGAPNAARKTTRTMPTKKGKQ
jgi:hypothetical protein